MWFQKDPQKLLFFNTVIRLWIEPRVVNKVIIFLTIPKELNRIESKVMRRFEKEIEKETQTDRGRERLI